MALRVSQNDIESELSYAYLHAVAARAGSICQLGTRLEDNNGIDAVVRVPGPFENAPYLKSVPIDVQLKATVSVPADDGTRLSYSFRGRERYEKLCEPCEAVPCVLVVLFLPPTPEQWLELTADALLLRRSAYWVSLRGAPPFVNRTEQTIYLPRNQLFTPDALRELAHQIALKNFPVYQAE